MPSAEINSMVTRKPEKPQHYTYLKSFRTEQCKDFLNHRCNQHRPFTCFFWHFPNQRRRRPVLNAKDGTFNYSPDIYCTGYDESTGVCPQGDSCPYLHRNIGDTEKRYHLRYYKTERCIIDTENKGSCTKNGPHCAFAHGPDDLRAPVFDVNERNVQSARSSDHSVDSESNGDKEKEKFVNIDPVWYDENYIKLYYKTEPCTRSSRHVTLSCPFYHNARDRRRRHDQYKYRAVVCPSVRHKEEWTDPSECELGDKCTYIHTRTEQQYHPDIYKTDKCHEEAANGRCSKGIFCAFAHEINPLPPVSPAKTTSIHGPIQSNSSLQAKHVSSTDLSPGAGRNKNQVNGSISGQAISNGAMPTSANSEVDNSWLGFNSLKLDSRSNDTDIQSRMKQFQHGGSSDLSIFYDRRLDYHRMYDPQLSNIISKPSTSSMTRRGYHPGIGENDSSFVASSALPQLSSEAHLLDRLDSLEDDNDHALLSLPNTGMTPGPVPQSSLFNSAGGSVPSAFSSFPVSIGLGSATSGLNPTSAPDFNYTLAGYIPSTVGFGLNPTSRLTMYGSTLQPTEVEKLRSELEEAKGIIKRLTEEKQQAIKEKEVLLHQAVALPDSKLTDSSYLRCLIPTADLEGLSVPYLQDLQVHLQLDLRRLQMVMARKAAGKCLACLERVATTLLPCKHKSLCEPCLLIAKHCPLCGASIPDQQQF